MNETELQVVCRECGSEVSPYVTECPYCGTRLRKRAPKLEHREDHFEPKPTARARLRRRLPQIGFSRADSVAEAGFIVPAAILAASVAVTLVRVAGDLSLTQVGALSGDVGDEWWRFLTASFAYDNVGYLFIVGVALAIFGSGLERTLGRFATVVLLLGCGALGSLAGYAMADVVDAAGPLIAGGNAMALGAVAAWYFVRRADVRAGRADDFDAVGVGVVAIVILLLPIVESSADVFTGVAGGLIGALLGRITAGRRPD